MACSSLNTKVGYHFSMLYSHVFEIYPLQQLRMSELCGPEI